MNFSLISLTLSTLSNSPVICNHASFAEKRITIQRSQFFRQSHPLFFGPSLNAKFRLTDSTMSQFLSQVIFIQQSFNYENKKFSLPIISLKKFSEPFTITNCQFVHVKPHASDGGAILCNSDLNISDCKFNVCSSPIKGGAIAAYSQLIVRNTLFQDCIADLAAAIFCSSFKKEDFLFSDASFFRCQSVNQQSIINKVTPANFQYICSNISYCYSVGFYGAILLTEAKTKVEYTIFNQISGPDFNAGLTVFKTNEFLVDSSLFANSSRKTKMDFSSVAIFVDHCMTREGIIKNSYFMNSQKMAPSINVRLGSYINVNDCYFYHDQRFETRLAGRIRMNNCHYEETTKMNKSVLQTPKKVIIMNRNKLIQNLELMQYVYYLAPLLISILFLCALEAYSRKKYYIN